MESKQNSINDIEDVIESKRLYHSDRYHSVSCEEKREIQNDLLKWYHSKKRTNMPWRKDVDKTWDREALAQRAYEVWVSEIMLQQTQVATVIDYYNRWMTAFPTIRDLSNADIEKVNSLWSGLGYYSRAKRLWEGAQKVVKELNGLLPDNAKELQSEIPGVGRYTAGAIASIVFNEQTPVVDGNVIRVLSRWRAIHADPKKAKTVELFWQIAASIVPSDTPGDFNQALMELGARVCTPRNPNCLECPIKKHCKALNQLHRAKELSKNGYFSENNKKRKNLSIQHECSVCHEIQHNLSEEDYEVERYPLKVDKKPPRDEECAVSIVEKIISNDSEPVYLISKRPNTGLLAGLWEFPTLELSVLNSTYETRSKESTHFLKTKYELQFDQANRYNLGNVVHLFSHIRKVYHVEWIQYQHENETSELTSDEAKWVTLKELKASPIPTGLKKALALLEKFKITLTKNKKLAVNNTGKVADIRTFFTAKK